MVIAIISILLVFFSVSIRVLCAASGEIKMFIVQCLKPAAEKVIIHNVG